MNAVYQDLKSKNASLLTTMGKFHVVANISIQLATGLFRLRNYSARLIRPNTSDLLIDPSAPSFLRKRESKQGFDDESHLHSRMETVCFVDFSFCGNDD